MQQNKTQDSTKPIHYVNSICGAGKTYTLLNNLKAGVFQGKTLIVLPTNKLIEQYEDDLKARAIIYSKVVSGENGHIKIVQLIKSALAPDYHIQLILCTHKGFALYCKEAALDESMQEALSNVNVIVDESPTDDFFSFAKVTYADAREENFPFTKWLTPSEDDPTILFLNEQYRDEVTRYYNEPHASSQHIKNVLWSALQGAAVITEDRPVKQPEDDNGEEDEMGECLDSVFFATTFPNPLLLASQWSKKFLLLGSNVHKAESIIQAGFQLGIQCKRADDIHWPPVERNRYTETTRVNITVVFKNPASKQKLYKQFTESILPMTVRKMGQGFIYATNNDSEGFTNYPFSTIADEWFKPHRGQRVSMSSYGLNIYAGHNCHGLTKEELMVKGIETDNADDAYMGYTKAVYLASVRDSGTRARCMHRLCKAMGFDYKEIAEARFHEQNSEKAMQFFARSALRDKSYTGDLNFVVTDLAMAEYLQENYFPDCTIEMLGVKEIERKPRTSDKGNETKDNVINLFNQGMKQKDIAEQLNLSKGRVSQLLKEIKAA
ncbi:hypothetical protein [Pantoea sp. Taur]|uniref:hypothetical protein n=1 Tax=Pantoea sp. Taur TaxID=2576757 RepID=UPI0013532B95|nr:hypothetical protein [Pantoea sp. Taur]MXP59548.1 hypothetical protein [Pantoea sp. Taur]